MTSVVVPAFNEARALPRLLSHLLDGARPGEFEILVVANGCTDDSAAVARSFGPAVRVIETPVPNKHRAMRLADEAAGAHFPRLYVDADVELGCADARLLAAAFEDAALLAAVPERTIGTGGCPWTVRWYYEFWLELPVVRAGLFGRGVIGVSRDGYARLAQIPELMGDDLAASLAFDPAERAVVSGAYARIHPPRTFADLLRRRIRVHTVTAQAGARTELADAGAAARTTRADIVALIRQDPLRMTPRAAWFLCVTLLARRKARKAIAAGDYTTWLRDESSRDQPAVTPEPAPAPGPAAPSAPAAPASPAAASAAPASFAPTSAAPASPTPASAAPAPAAPASPAPTSAAPASPTPASAAPAPAAPASPTSTSAAPASSAPTAAAPASPASPPAGGAE